MPSKYGVRIYAMPDSDIILIKQTVKRPESLRYVVDALVEGGTHREAHINVDDTAGYHRCCSASLERRIESEVRKLEGAPLAPSNLSFPLSF